VTTIELPGSRASAAQARRFVRDTLTGWGIGGDAVEDCELLVSELVTNAIIHADSNPKVSLEQAGTRVRASVCDSSASLPRVRDYGPDAITGRGMLLVDRLARRWGVDTGTSGKCVWFEMDTTERGNVSAGARS
jgi:anti-sigma regulatory factor (Ser/Thr protein kinase)